jgi:gliding motility-associated-like protein
MRRWRWIVLLLVISVGAHAPAWGAFASQGKVALSASVLVTGTNTSGSTLTIQATPLPSQVLFGKNLAIPITVTSSAGTINPNNLRVDIVFQLLDQNGALLNPPTPVPVQFIAGAASGNTLKGTAIVLRSDLLPVQNGGRVTYVFQAKQGGAGTMLNSGGTAPAPANITALQTLPSPFVTAIRDPWCEPVGPAGAKVSPADLSENDGQTAVALARGAVASPGNLCFHVQSPDGLPLGPGQSKAAAIYTITLENTSLLGTAQLVLSYPSDSSGKVLDLNADPSTLGMYWLDQNSLAAQWLPLSRATLDSTLHTLTGMTAHFSMFALFPAGAIGSADLRPPQRIITPNGDGTNDTAIFSGLADGDQVKIFDVRGRRVRTIPGPNAVWDGKDDSGKVVESGVYLYQYTISGDRVSGVILVAK